MRKEYLRIDNGMKEIEGMEQIYSIFLHIYEGECCGIISGNTSQLNCLVDILRGEKSFDSGILYYRGQMLSEPNDVMKLRKKVGIVNSQSRFVENLTISENVFIVQSRNEKVFVSHRQLGKQLKLLFENFAIDIRPNCRIKDLKNLERCQLELLKSYVLGIECMIIDLRLQHFTEDELETLYNLVDKLKARGMTFISVDYIVEQVIHYSDSLMLLNAGKTIGIIEYPPFEKELIYQMLLNGKADLPAGAGLLKAGRIPEVALQMQEVCAPYLKKLNFSVHRGEIVVFMCEERKSMESLCSLIKGERKTDTGAILVNHQKFKASGYKHAAGQGIGFIEDQHDGNNLFYNMSVYDNICIAKGTRVKRLWWQKKYRKNVEQFITEIFDENIGEKKLKELDNDKLQMIVYYRWLLYHPEVIVCVNPFSNVDIHMSRLTERIIREYAARGIGVLILSQDFWVSGDSKDTVYVLQNEQLKKLR